MFNQILKNDYIKQCDSSTFTVLFDYYNPNKIVNFIHALISYPEWKTDTDIFQYVIKLEQLKYDSKTYFLFDASTEGFSPSEVPFFEMLYYNCKKYNVPAEKVLFISSNMLDHKNIQIFNKKNKIKNSIRVFNFLSFKKMILDLVEDDISKEINPEKMFNYFQARAKKEYNEKYFLSLSRVNRPHRIMATYLLSNSGFASHGHISHDTVKTHELKYVSRNYDLDRTSLDAWANNLPLTVDTYDFETNHALTINSHLHHSTLFQIINETLADSVKNTSLFYSEKTFRTIAHMQPFVIFGQQHCNKKLEDFGFKLYYKLFDYSFDDVADEKLRYIKLLETISDVVSQLNNMSKDEQLKWRFKCKEILVHNFKTLTDLSTDEDKFKTLYKQLLR